MTTSFSAGSELGPGPTVQGLAFASVAHAASFWKTFVIFMFGELLVGNGETFEADETI